MVFVHFVIFQYGAFFEKDEKVKAEKMKKVGEETIPNNLVGVLSNIFTTIINYIHETYTYGGTDYN